MSKHTYKDELYERLKVAFPNLNGFKIMRIAEDIMKNPSNNPSILCKERRMNLHHRVSRDNEYHNLWQK